MGFVKALRCRECHREYPKEAIHVCEFCFGPLEVAYDYEEIKKSLTKKAIARRPQNVWRYGELLPIDEEPTLGHDVGFTPLFRADRLAEALGVEELYIKNDAVCHPSLSFKDRVVAVALSKAREFGYDTVACASTGNLANSVAANAAASGLMSYVFIPYDLERGKVLGSLVYGANLVGIRGTYDEVNRLCSEVAGKYDWAFVNINIRPYYAEGSKTLGFEVAEQMGWRLPNHIIVPMGSGSLLTKIKKAFDELHLLGFISSVNCKVHGAQASGCAPIVEAIKQETDLIKPAIPDTIAKSIAIGNPADGFYALKTIRDSGGWAEDVTDEELIQGMKLLAQTEGVFAETAGGVTVAVAKKLVSQGRIPPDESIVLCITGNGLKTQESIMNDLPEPNIIDAKLSEFDKLV